MHMRKPALMTLVGLLCVAAGCTKTEEPPPGPVAVAAPAPAPEPPKEKPAPKVKPPDPMLQAALAAGRTRQEIAESGVGPFSLGMEAAKLASVGLQVVEEKSDKAGQPAKFKAGVKTPDELQLLVGPRGTVTEIIVRSGSWRTIEGAAIRHNATSLEGMLGAPKAVKKRDSEACATFSAVPGREFCFASKAKSPTWNQLKKQNPTLASIRVRQ